MRWSFVAKQSFPALLPLPFLLWTTCPPTSTNSPACLPPSLLPSGLFSVLVARARSAANRGMMNPIKDASWFIVLMVLGAGWAYLRPELFERAPYMMVLLFGLLHVDMAVHLMVCHICNLVCRSFR